MRNGPYVLVVAPEGYPGRRYRGKYAYEHHLVWWRATGQTLAEGMVVHHKNHKKHDNRFENLELISISDHARAHARARHPNGPTMVDLVCHFCEKPFQREKHRFKPGQPRYFCGRAHQVSQQQKDLWALRRNPKTKRLNQIQAAARARINLP